jgi:hypothetical protein
VTPVIHLVQLEKGAARPVCGGFAESPNWTIVRSVATCPACIRCDLGAAASVTVRESEPAWVDLDQEPA